MSSLPALLLALLAPSRAAVPSAAVPSAAVPSAAVLEADWAAALPLLRQDGRFAVELSAADLATVAAGGTARHRMKLQGLDRVVGATWTDQPRDRLWISILDDTCFTLVEGLTERHLPSADPLRKILFQHVDVPWPFSDRQWILDIRSNADLYTHSAGRTWERSWALAAPPEGDPARIPDPAWPAADAVWTPVNEGGWLLVDAGGGSLLVYHARVDVGGALPEEASTAWALSTLRGLLQRVVARAAAIPGHYGPGHAPVLRPDGSPIPPP